MNRSSKAITLALIGSAFLLNGCEEPEPQEEETGQANSATPHRGGGGGVFIAPRIGGAIGGGSGVSSSPSARGGFGSTGSASVGS